MEEMKSKERKLQLHFWYIEERVEEGGRYKIGHGIVTGHKRLSDTIAIHTSLVQNISFEEEHRELVVKTQHSIYYCPIEYCCFTKQDKYPEAIPDYESLKEQYKDKITYPSIEKGNVLLVLANFCDYYFHSLYFIPMNSCDEKPVKAMGYPHIGDFQDSFLINGGRNIDLRYFPHRKNVEFYTEYTDGCPWFIENIGDTTLYARTKVGVLKLDPGDRKEVIKENAEKAPPSLPDGDLYPALFF